jgi:hypothetical protein
MTKKPTAFDWIDSHKDYQGSECLTWPYFRDQNGYGRLGRRGQMFWAHRAMCERAHGPAPSSAHEAAHSCGNGKRGCVNPCHLAWKTKSENQRERRVHGTHGKGKGPRYKFTAEQVAYVRANPDRLTQAQLAAMFGVSWQNIGMIQRGETYREVSKIPRHFTDEEIAAIHADGRTHREIGADYGVPQNTIWRIKNGKQYVRAA